MFFFRNYNEVARRIKQMHEAEAKLLYFSYDFGQSSQRADDNGFELEIFDTLIPRSEIPLNSTGGCLLYPKGINDEGVTEENKNVNNHDTFSIHGMHSWKKNARKSKESSTEPLVLLHGYSNGALYFYRNIVGLSKSYLGDIYALDMLGWGLSSRPKFETKDSSVESAESFFVESLEAWRKAKGIDKMILGGHSMGGYVGAAYCEKYPERVSRLLLLSPVGVPRKEEKKNSEGIPLKFRIAINVANLVWISGITPPAFIRAISEFRGREMVNSYVTKRLPAIKNPSERSALSDYLYLNAILPGSGEYCLNRILMPMAYARHPLVDRIPNLKVKHISFIYGDMDWMDESGGAEVIRRCKEANHNGSGNGGFDSPIIDLYRVHNAGHLLMLENWREFNAAVLLGCGIELDDSAPRPDHVATSSASSVMYQ